MTNETIDLEKQLADVTLKIYEEADGRIETTWPWVLVRLCHKQAKLVAGLFTPGDQFGGNLKQNSPLFEGIVLETWKPHWSRFRKYGEPNTEKEIWRESDFKRGDRILFPGFAGLQPPKFLDEHRYRLVREWTFDANGGAMCIVHYDQDKEMRSELERVFANTTATTLSGK